MLENIKLENVLFLDIETVPQSSDFADLTEQMQKLWLRKAEKLTQNSSSVNASQLNDNLYGRAGIYSEFGKIICISIGAFINNELRVKAFAGDDEKLLLLEFADLLNKRYNKPEHLLCAHNGKEFDFPFIARRMLILGIKVPTILDIAGKKPWEVNHLDTMELWKFGDYKNYTSLELLASIFNIPTPKDDIDGSQVAQVYYIEKDLERIVKYCNKDVLTVAQIIMRFRGQPIISTEQIVFTN